MQTGFMLATFLKILVCRQSGIFANIRADAIGDRDVDYCLEDPKGWTAAPVGLPGQGLAVAKVLTQSHNESLLWGTYQPNQYFSIKSRTTPASLSQGILWHGPGGSAARARSECKQDDNLKKYGFTHHDGRTYARQAIEDPLQNVRLTTEFVKFPSKQSRLQEYWASRVSVSLYEAKQQEAVHEAADGPVTFLYLAIDCDGFISPLSCLSSAGSGGLSIKVERRLEGAVALITGRTAQLGLFTLEVMVSSDDSGRPISLSFIGLASQLLADLKSRIEASQRTSVRAKEGKGNQLGDLDIWRLSDTVEADSNIIVLRVAGEGPYQVVSRLREQDRDEEEPDIGELNPLRRIVDEACQRGQERFKARFEKVFGLSKKGFKERQFNPEEITVAQAAFSNLMGGIGFFYGRTTVKGRDGQRLQSFPSALFTASPSRSFFPRGFLWDEGFHQLTLARWDPALSYDVILHWLSQVHQHPNCPELGWIPREISLGAQSIRQIPSDFLAQDVQVANPPTILLTLENLLSLPERPGICEAETETQASNTSDAVNRKLDFYEAVRGRVEMWVRWQLATQQGPVKGAYRWRGRGSPNERLMATTFASGLDDYPRASEPTPEERHLDLLCWMIKSCQVLAKLAEANGPTTGNAELFRSCAAELSAGLDALHWNETLQGYFDWGRHSEDGHFADLVEIRCINAAGTHAVDVSVLADFGRLNPGQNPCPTDFPRLLGRTGSDIKETYLRGTIAEQHVPRVGYVSLFPLLLDLLQPNSPRLGPLLQAIRDPKQLWSEYGVRSLSKSDPYYAKENAPGDAPYWRGYIWININYLLLRTLWHLKDIAGPYQKEAEQLYQDLRDRILRNLIKQFQESGYFWEQYSDQTGQGLRSHPFSGWTSLIVNIMAEEY